MDGRDRKTHSKTAARFTTLVPGSEKNFDAFGYELKRQKGSHEQWVKSGRTFTLACHGKDTPHYVLDALEKLVEELDG